MLRLFRFLVLGLGAAISTARASGARVENMAALPTQAAAVAPANPLKGNVAVGTIAGGEDTNPLWMSKVGNPEFA